VEVEVEVKGEGEGDWDWREERGEDLGDRRDRGPRSHEMRPKPRARASVLISPWW
jgi:hypothetical protein